MEKFASLTENFQRWRTFSKDADVNYKIVTMLLWMENRLEQSIFISYYAH